MLWTIAVVMLVLWALGLVSSYTMGGFIHLLLVLALIGWWSGSCKGAESGRLQQVIFLSSRSVTFDGSVKCDGRLRQLPLLLYPPPSILS